MNLWHCLLWYKSDSKPALKLAHSKVPSERSKATTGKANNIRGQCSSIRSGSTGGAANQVRNIDGGCAGSLSRYGQADAKRAPIRREGSATPFIQSPEANPNQYCQLWQQRLQPQPDFACPLGS